MGGWPENETDFMNYSFFTLLNASFLHKLAPKLRWICEEQKERCFSNLLNAAPVDSGSVFFSFIWKGPLTLAPLRMALPDTNYRVPWKTEIDGLGFKLQYNWYINSFYDNYKVSFDHSLSNFRNTHNNTL